LALFKNVNLEDGRVNDGPNGFFNGNASLKFYDAPNLAEVQVGGGGLPGSPYGPNIASPGAGNGLNYSAIPAAGVEATNRAVGGVVVGEVGLKNTGGAFGIGNGLTSPSKTTRAIVAELSPDTIVTPTGVRTLTLGRGSQDSFKP
jgi:hypothetical protein